MIQCYRDCCKVVNEAVDWKRSADQWSENTASQLKLLNTIYPRQCLTCKVIYQKLC